MRRTLTAGDDRALIDYCGHRGPIQRLWLSALNEASIHQALNSVKQGSETYPLYLSALAPERTGSPA
ncbi:hypothetical protein KUIN1_15110 [Pseudomonas sp. KUIN-1]|nr:hypothetical protein KUIN1_15110 [Pseudomonas sp. KUIN-1]